MTNFYHLIYSSRAIVEFELDELEHLIKIARFNNFIHQVTGVLLYGEQRFIQVLEGTKTNVEAIFEKILLDKRHHTIQIEKQDPIVERAFSNWNMGLTVFSQHPDLENRLINQLNIDGKYNSLSHFTAVNLIKTFCHEEFVSCIQ